MPTFNIEYREIERREIKVTADNITDAIKFVEDGGFYLGEEVKEEYPKVKSWEGTWGIDFDGRQVISVREERDAIQS